MINLMHGDCLELMRDIPGASVDLILTDPPYGTTECRWDTIIPLDKMWKELQRIIKPKSVIALFCAEPFASKLRMSNIKAYRYEWIWDKILPTGFLNAKKRPLKRFENICIFSAETPVYYPIMETRGKPRNKGGYANQEKIAASVYRRTNPELTNNNIYYPNDILQFNNANQSEKSHPTQKPTALLEYLIRAYTLRGQTVLDFTMGAGSTGVACVNTGRNFIGIELDDEYFEIAKNRIADAVQRKEAQPDLIPDAEIFREPDPTLF